MDVSNSQCIDTNVPGPGAGGGSELWEYLVAEMSLDYVQRVEGRAPSAQMKQKLLDSFNDVKGGCGPEFPGQEFNCLVKDENDSPINVIFEEAKITSCFNEAMALPLALARDKIEELTTLVSSDKVVHPSPDICVEKPRVILAGGTARHEGIQRRIEKICQRNDLPKPVMTDNIINQYE
jgi:hypothetical protein